jgi:glutaredoxin
MPLTTCPHCHKSNSRWSIYLRLNKREKRSEKQYTCPHCHSVSKIDFPHSWRHKNLGVFARGVLPLLMIIAFLMQYISRREAIGLVIIYHFACFVGIIQYSHRKK